MVNIVDWLQDTIYLNWNSCKWTTAKIFSICQRGKESPVQTRVIRT